MDQIICAFLFHTHYWYEVSMLKVPTVADPTKCYKKKWFINGCVALVVRQVVSVETMKLLERNYARCTRDESVHIRELILFSLIFRA